MADPEKRRLPVLQSSDEDEERPPWHWSVIGTVAILIAAVPLAMLASWYARHELEKVVDSAADRQAIVDAMMALTPGQRLWLSLVSLGGRMLALALGALLGGVLVGKLGAPAGKREATAAGLAAGVIVSLFAAWEAIRQGGLTSFLLSGGVVIAVAVVFARTGAWLVLRKRG